MLYIHDFMYIITCIYSNIYIYILCFKLPFLMYHICIIHVLHICFKFVYIFIKCLLYSKLFFYIYIYMYDMIYDSVHDIVYDFAAEVFRTAHGDQRTGEWREASPPDSFRASKQFDVNQGDSCMKYDEV